MSRYLINRSVLALLFAGAFAACDRAPTAPDLSSVVAFDGFAADSRTSGRTNTGARPGTTSGRVPVDTLRPCRPDETPNLTPEQIEKIRALWAAYHAEVAPLLRYIAMIEQQAREAAANGASRERVAEIVAQADEAKRAVAKATQRLRDAINEVLSEDQRRNHCLIAVPVGR